MTLQACFLQLREQLKASYDEREAALIAEMLLERITGHNRSFRIVHPDTLLNATQLGLLDAGALKLKEATPIQYVLEEAWFRNAPYYVNDAVLIPRPETEELVEWCLETIDEMEPTTPLSLLDIGTGSGCIAISLKQALEQDEVHALDISLAALAVAQRNAQTLQQEIIWHRRDILSPKAVEDLPIYDIIISNPPYIPEKDKSNMEAHVLSKEPHLALFVPDRNPLVFYKAIAAFAKTHLKAGGFIFLEVHAEWGNETAKLMRSAGFSQVSLRKDMQGLHRMIKVTK